MKGKAMEEPTLSVTVIEHQVENELGLTKTRANLSAMGMILGEVVSIEDTGQGAQIISVAIPTEHITVEQGEPVSEHMDVEDML